MPHFPATTRERIPLEDDAKIVVIGGGPAGAFLAITILRSARRAAKNLDVVIIEKKRELQFYEAARWVPYREGCNYCAGGVSPRLADVLEAIGLTLPQELVQSQVDSLTVHGEWKNIELPIPAGRTIFSVFRGSRPARRPGRHLNFDSFLLDKAVEEGARVITGEVLDVHYSPKAKPIVTYRLRPSEQGPDATIEADFVVFAAGVNQSPGIKLEEGRLVQVLRALIPGFRPPKVRKALICELEADSRLLQTMQGELHFAEYGSATLKIEMSSLIPKSRCITVVLLGRSVDRAHCFHDLQIVRDFLGLPHIRRLLPSAARLAPLCVCNPNMTVGAARRPFGHRIAVVGDMAASRLYKDGILSAYVTASSLAECMLETGVDRKSLRRYGGVVRRFARDGTLGRLVFLFNRITSNNRVLSRILYQAVIMERKTTLPEKRRLGHLLWKIASGDDGYGRILASMFHPATLATIVAGGVLVTVRNYVSELVFGLRWRGFGRWPTAVPKEVLETKRKEMLSGLRADKAQDPRLARGSSSHRHVPTEHGLRTTPVPGRTPSGRREFGGNTRKSLLGRSPSRENPEPSPDFESMYSIRIKAEASRIFRELGKFGDDDREYFKPRMIGVHRTAGNANEAGSIIQYDVVCPLLSFSIVLQDVIEDRCLTYRVRDGFARGGVLVFRIDRVREGVSLLSIYVGFDFPRGDTPLRMLGWSFFKAVFPGFLHDVLWNHSLCKLKDVVETQER